MIPDPTTFSTSTHSEELIGLARSAQRLRSIRRCHLDPRQSEQAPGPWPSSALGAIGPAGLDVTEWATGLSVVVSTTAEVDITPALQRSEATTWP